MNNKTKRKINKIGILTSGGDAPGMNAAIRSVTRSAIKKGIKVIGIRRGYQGMIEGDFTTLSTRSVSGILHQGGTILKTARCNDFRTVEGRTKAYDNLKLHGIDALVVIGGDGTFTGAQLFTQETDIPTVGMPGTIDNDMYGTDYTIGHDTALNTAVEAIDKLKDTARSHGRIFIVEVMGNDAGDLALYSGIACGAEAILIPEVDEDDDLDRFIRKGIKKKETSGIIVVAEGDEHGGAIAVAERVKKENPKLEVRVSILGHMQRGGNPTAIDRIMATRMGVGAVDALLDDQKSIMVGIKDGEIVHVPFNKCVKGKREFPMDLYEMNKEVVGE
ncbi:MAG: 6-phosphofructokinase [Bacteroidales bacterium]